RSGGYDFLIFELAHHNVENDLLLIAEHLHSHLFVHRSACHDDRQITRVLDLFTVEFNDHVADLDAGLFRRTVFGHVGHQRALAFFHAEALGDLGRHFLDQHAQITAHDFALAAQLRQQLLYEIDRNSEADADITAGAAEDRRVDADDFAAQIEERPAGIARIDRRVG